MKTVVRLVDHYGQEVYPTFMRDYQPQGDPIITFFYDNDPEGEDQSSVTLTYVVFP